ncbi:ABC transporter substrate-binding protein [uncultured Gemmiger sp.]|uniref:ABC transporter substrate-binding protein n=1 Tax=uncultured Gemmiger sp. TaxID=1623490 RepID=UPI0025D2FABD|nr:ABC transporter substrate-binding protein [uncultured Gemmiger sp.]
MKRIISLFCLLLACCLLAGCAARAAARRPGTFALGDPSFSAEHEINGIDPHNAYSGWACIRYGIGETLFRYSDRMEVQPWLASGYERLDSNTWRITLRDGVRFTSGRMLDGAAVKECLEHLIRVHDRARADLKIAGIQADGQTVTITTAEPNPALLNNLSDPYGCIIDLQATTADGLVAGTGPYRAVEMLPGQRLELEPNRDYWDGTPQMEHITVRTISDGDTLTMALQAGEIDAAYGLPFLSLPIFQNGGYTISSAATSRVLFVAMNFSSPVLQQQEVRRAVAMGIDKQSFAQVLLGGNGQAAAGPFPAGFAFGGGVAAPEYDPQAACALLEQAGWVDTDGDGIREKDGQQLTLRWLTYPSRQELPLLAESAQATLRQIGIEVSVLSTASHTSLRADPEAWDMYASALVTAPTGDPAYFFSSCCLDGSSANHGGYHSDALEALAGELAATFDTGRRNRLAVQMQQQILDDDAYIFCAHLEMNLVARAGVTGLTAHPCDYYEITAALQVE